MKLIQNGFVIALFLLVGALSKLPAADSTNPPASFQENWQTISNRWGSVSLEKIKQAAETNDVAAQFYLATVYSDGDGVPQDNIESFKWTKLAAQQGMVRAQIKLGWMLQSGLGVETNVDEAVEWYEKAAHQGDTWAQFRLGWMYEHGSGVPQDYDQAAKFYRLAAEQGHAMAQNNLGWLYKNGWGLPEDEAEALTWFQKSADQGESLGEENLAWIFAHGAYGPKAITNYGPGALLRSGGVAPNHELAEKWMRKAVDLNTMEGEYKLGNLIYNEMAIRTNEQQENLEQDGTRFLVAAEWLKKAAERGHAQAQYQLADMYNTGKLGDDQRSNCIPWFLKAAAQGNVQAQAAVGELPVLYPNNELLKSVNNIEILRQGGEQGDLNAQYQLARRYQFGIGVPKDPVEAFKWMQKAAHNETASSVIGDAIYCLAVMYEKGEGVTQDVAQAHSLFLEAAGPAFSQRGAAFRVGQMYEKGEGVLQDDQKAAEFYANRQIFFPDNDKYPNGMISYHGVTASGVESLLRLWSQGRGLPNEQEKALPGYKEPGAQVRYWANSLGTVEAHYFTGEIYYQGKLVPQDLVEAAARFHLAANQHLPDAQKALSEVELKMSPEQKTAEKSRLESLEKNFEMIKQTAEAQQQGEDYAPWGAPL